MKYCPLILIGGGGHCKSVIDVIEACQHEIKGIVDMPSETENCCLGYPVIGCDDDIPKFVDDYDFVVTLGAIKNPKRRVQLHEYITINGGRLATIISTKAHVSRHSEIGEGTVVLNYANVNAEVKIGKGCIINSGANIEHDVIIGDYSHVSTGAMINGNSKIGSRCFIGSGTVVNNGISIANDVVVGSGSVVNRDIVDAGVYVGVPVKRIK